MTTAELIDYTHNDLMNQSADRVTAIYESMGRQPCVAALMAYDVMEPAWQAWSLLADEIARLNGGKVVPPVDNEGIW